MKIQRNTEGCRQTHTHADKPTGTHTDIHTNRQGHKQAAREADRETH